MRFDWYTFSIFSELKNGQVPFSSQLTLSASFCTIELAQLATADTMTPFWKLPTVLSCDEFVTKVHMMK